MSEEEKLMDKEHQIEEMARDLCSKYTICTCSDRNGRCATPQQHARIMYELGYRKQRKGKWIKATPYSQEYCNQCGLTPKMVFGILPDYCPHCGAEMEGKEDGKKEPD